MSTNCNFDHSFIPANCQDFAVGGTTGRMWIINKDDWDNAVKVVGASGEINSITLTGTGTQAYRIESPRGSITTDSVPTPTSGGSIGGFTHTINCVFPDLSQDMKNSLSSLINLNTAVVIVETQAAKPAASGGGDTKSPPYQLFGNRNGLELSGGSFNLGDQATGGSISATLTTPTTTQLELAYPVNLDMSTADIIALETPVI